MSLTSKEKILSFAHLLIAVAVMIVAVLQFLQAKKQSEMAEVQTQIAQQQTELVERQQEILTTQVRIDLLMFVREYINGYAYLYDIVRAESVVPRVKEIRGVGLPAIAVPSQYSHYDWLIIAPPLSQFKDFETAEKEILAWRYNLKAWEKEKKAKNLIFDKYQRKQAERGVNKLVFLYKADILINRRYFEELAKSNEFLVDPNKF